MELAPFLRQWFRHHPEDEPLGKWWAGIVACAICNHRWAAVVELEPGHRHPIVSLECPSCGHMAGAPE